MPRILSAKETIRAAIGADVQDVTSARTKASSKASRNKNAPQAKGKAKATPERSNKKTEVIAMMKRSKGATLAEIVAATGWHEAYRDGASSAFAEVTKARRSIQKVPRVSPPVRSSSSLTRAQKKNDVRRIWSPGRPFCFLRS
jgi:Protein of unknown function (DUF3489)